MPPPPRYNDSEDALVVSDATVERGTRGDAKHDVVGSDGCDQTDWYQGHAVDRDRGAPGKGRKETDCAPEDQPIAPLTAPTKSMAMVSKSQLLELAAKKLIVPPPAAPTAPADRPARIKAALYKGKDLTE